MENKRYNGWFNYETWAVKLWMDNEESSYNYWRERTEEHIERSIERLDDEERTNKKAVVEEAASVLADELKDEHEEALPELKGFAADLLNAAMSEVNWYEIAESMLNDMVEEHPEMLKE